MRPKAPAAPSRTPGAGPAGVARSGWTAFAGTTGRYLLHARLLGRAAPAPAFGTLVVTVASAATTTLTMVATGRFVGTLPAAVAGGPGSPAAHEAWDWLVLSAVLLLLGPLLTGAQQLLIAHVSARFLRLTAELALQVGTAPYGVERLEDPERAGRLEALHQSMREWRYVAGVESTWRVLAVRLSGVGAFVVVSTWHWWVALVLAAGYLLLSKAFTAWINTLWDDLLSVTGTSRRAATYLRNLLIAPATGKEVRLFGLTGWLVDRFRRTWLAAMTVVWQRRSRTFRPMLASLLLMFALYLGALAVLTRDAVAGSVSLGAIAILVQALVALEALGPLGDDQSMLAATTAVDADLARLRRDAGLPPVPATGRPAGPAEPPATRAPIRTTPAAPGPAGSATAPLPLPLPRHRAAGVEIADLRFTYPARREPTFTGLSLAIPAGQSVAVVGPNGAGKSTLIKLLCGLYRPDAGRIAVDGADPGVDPAARRRVAVIFQDFVRYQLSVRDNVGFGALPLLADDAALTRALADAGAARLLDRMPAGLATTLSAEYAGGTDLSGGQWQRIALARALAAVAAGAGVLVLDEPTAALDVRAEAALFDRFLRLTAGLTTLLVSHRLSSVRHAQRIVVLGETPAGRGQVVEDGSHEQLLAAGGAYARMFTLQAQRFVAAGGGTGPRIDRPARPAQAVGPSGGPSAGSSGGSAGGTKERTMP